MPALDCAYKLEEYAGRPRRKRSTGKATWPGRKQVWRRYGPDGRMAGDILSVEGDGREGEPLLQPVMKGGRRIAPAPLSAARARAKQDLARLPEALQRLEPAIAYPVEVARVLAELTEEADRRIAGMQTQQN